MIAFSATLDRELGGSVHRALMRIDHELREADRADRSGQARTPEQRRADALVVLVFRLAEAKVVT
jgi:hypothetical protein